MRACLMETAFKLDSDIETGYWRERSERDYENDKNSESLIHSPIGMARWIVAAALLGTFVFEFRNLFWDFDTRT